MVNVGRVEFLMEEEGFGGKGWLKKKGMGVMGSGGWWVVGSDVD